MSFPIAFARATVQGVEAKLELPRWGPVSGFASYTNFRGTGEYPVTGGLFLDDNAAALLAGSDRVRPVPADAGPAEHGTDPLAVAGGEAGVDSGGGAVWERTWRS